MYPLFITTEDAKKFTAANGNIDDDKFIQFLKIAQDIHIQNYLGSNLFEKISNDIINNTLTGDYLALVNNHIKPMLIHYGMTEYLPFAAYTVANKGVYKHGSENSSTVDKNEVDFLVEKERQIAEHYTRRFLDYICANAELFPEYNNNTSEDMKPDKNAAFNGWYLDDNNKDYYKYKNLEL